MFLISSIGCSSTPPHRVFWCGFLGRGDGAVEALALAVAAAGEEEEEEALALAFAAAGEVEVVAFASSPRGGDLNLRS
jgi:hypothetical protein